MELLAREKYIYRILTYTSIQIFFSYSKLQAFSRLLNHLERC